jgi:thiamine-phosphate pyrophosphorylase
MNERPLVCLVTDRQRLGAGSRAIDDLVGLVKQAGIAGVNLVQIRETDLPGRELLALAERVVAALAGTSARALVNDRVDVALAAGAAGVHLKADSVEAGAVRRITPADFIIGRSVHSPDEAVDAEHSGVDYVVLGTVFETTSKPRGARLAGLRALEDAAGRCRVPVLGIGGMTLRRLPAVAETGAAGIAAIGLFLGPRPPGEDLAEHLARVMAEVRRCFPPR